MQHLDTVSMTWRIYLNERQKCLFPSTVHSKYSFVSSFVSHSKNIFEWETKMFIPINSSFQIQFLCQVRTTIILFANNKLHTWIPILNKQEMPIFAPQQTTRAGWFMAFWNINRESRSYLVFIELKAATSAGDFWNWISISESWTNEDGGKRSAGNFITTGGFLVLLNFQ